MHAVNPQQQKLFLWKENKQSEQKNTEIKYVIKSFPIKKTPGYEVFTTEVYQITKN